MIVENRVWLPEEEAVKMHGYPVMQVVQYSVPTCTWGPPPPDLLRPPPISVGEHFIELINEIFGRETFSILFFFAVELSNSINNYNFLSIHWKFISNEKSLKQF